MDKGHEHSSGLKCLQVPEAMDTFALVRNYNVLSFYFKKELIKSPVDLEEMLPWGTRSCLPWP